MNSYRAASLDYYRRDLSDLRTLDPDEEKASARAWAAGDQAAGARLVEGSLPFVIRIAKEYRHWGVPFEDLIQQGNVGLLKAAAKFDPGRDCRLITYAVFWIRAEIREYVMRGYRTVRLGTTRTERRAIRMFRRETVENVEELAERSGMPLKRARALWPLLLQRDRALDATYDERGPGVERLSSNSMDPEAEAMTEERRQGVRARLASAMAVLSDREQLIVESRFMADRPRTLESIGRQMGVSKERVRQLEARARRKLQGVFADYAPVAA